MNKLKIESFFNTKRKTLFLDKTQRYFWLILLLFVTEIAITLFQFYKYIRGVIGFVRVLFLNKLKI